KSVVENINLPPSLLSRFDLIYIMLDVPNEVGDKKLATHILDIYSQRGTNKNAPRFYSKEILAKYISYAREYCKPTLSEAAGKRIAEEYQAMRNIGMSSRTISATPRQLESMIRISEAFAKMRLAGEVTVEDVEEAVSLIKEAMQQSATDPTTGMINMDIIITGRSAAMKMRISSL
ncbi:unnamed protein product, partial [Sphagnum balticum]